jgi:hypothetical protein
MDDKTKNIQPEIENLNLDEIDVEELEKRLELAAAAADVWICGVYDNELTLRESVEEPVVTD